jgi:hypothetical protein
MRELRPNRGVTPAKAGVHPDDQRLPPGAVTGIGMDSGLRRNDAGIGTPDGRFVVLVEVGR